MSAPASPPRSAVVATDHSKPLAVRPLIADLLRTRCCVQGCILLVESVDAHIPVSTRCRTVRLLLGDGHQCIQALLRPELHRLVDGGQIYVGCYVRLDRFEVKTVPPRSAEGNRGGPPQPEQVDMVFLVVTDMSTVGWNTAYVHMAERAGQGQESPVVEARPQVAAGTGQAVGRKTQEPRGLPTARRPPAPPDQVQTEDRGGDNGLEATAAPGKRTHERRDEADVLRQRTTIGSLSSCTATHQLPWASDDLSKPLKLTPLRSIPNLPYKQNWVVNILAVLASLSEVEPASLAPYKQQRTARLADPSTGKQVLLTVFLDPDEFAPEVGSVILLLGVKNHRFDGGSLKKYENERPKEGSRWWFENPTDIEWCDVQGLREWWSGALTTAV